ncbi:hypothetical protein EDC19_1512 [Natranaerovirga hydrolytica]|uniref:Uncharacterized protein n=1 Tax=Natranaerovirga hydrolytica TaxID=680378 RepID=A0A4R1MMI2_9FIRM|nr:hypothetical protein [Natranaerovirga hydrolytica]TCK93320.1 hypothetical protein EDC19_1512 [Natranaerovirga hydrolytica]
MKITLYRLSIIVSLMLVVFISSYFITKGSSIEKEPISTTISTGDMPVEEMTFEIGEDDLENFLNYTKASLSNRYDMKEILLNHQGHIIITLLDAIDTNEIRYIYAIIDSVAKVFNIYDESHESYVVELNHKDGYEEFEIKKDTGVEQDVTNILITDF